MESFVILLIIGIIITVVAVILFFIIISRLSKPSERHIQSNNPHLGWSDPDELIKQRKQEIDAKNQENKSNQVINIQHAGQVVGNQTSVSHDNSINIHDSVVTKTSFERDQKYNTCPVCSREIKPHWKVCPKCSNKLEGN